MIQFEKYLKGIENMSKLMHWYDFETSSANPSTQALQFASVTTDENLNVIEGSECNLLSIPRRDIIPSPVAYMIHMLDVDHLHEYGMPERDLMKQIRDRFLYASNSQSCGYNTMKFDDTVFRHSLFRNFMNPYEHEWKNGNTRFDAFKQMQFVYALRPELLVIPKKDDGSDSLKLEALSKANGIVHERAHDALSDVYATIGLSKLVKEQNEKLYDYIQGLTDKNKNFELANSGRPLVHVNYGYGADNRNSSVILPLVRDLGNKNKFISVDLRQDPYDLLNMNPEEISHYLFTKRAELPDNAPKVPVKTFQINDMPLIIPATKGLLTQDLCARNKFDPDAIERNMAAVLNCRDLKTRLQKAFKYQAKENLHVFDSLYAGFFSRPDEGHRSEIASMSQDQVDELDMVDVATQRDDKPKALELLVAMKSAESMSLIEKAILHRQLNYSFNDSDSHMTFERFHIEVRNVRQERDLTPDQEIVLQKTIAHVEKLYADYEALDNFVSEHRSEIDAEIARKNIPWLVPYLSVPTPSGVMPLAPFRTKLESPGPGM